MTYLLSKTFYTYFPEYIKEYEETSLISVIIIEPKRKTALKYYEISYAQFSIDTLKIVGGNLQATLWKYTASKITIKGSTDSCQHASTQWCTQQLMKLRHEIDE